ncbi:MAG: ABC transporter ATP-binding protein [Opitutaceae bacterium]
MSSAPAVSVFGLWKRFGAVEAVRGVGFEVARGEVFGLIGPNGAGKTTALECLLGLCEPDEGEIRILGLEVRDHPDAVRRKVGAQLQVSALPDAMTPRQALRLCARFYPVAVAADELLERFGLADKADARFSGLSAGQRQRLALAQAFINEPEVVILDEPTAGLDPNARKELHGLISSQRSAGRAVLFTTHDLEEARTLCDRIAIIDRGRVLALDAPEALVARSAALARLFVRTEPVLAAEDLKGLPRVLGIEPAPGGWSLETASVNRTVAGLATLAEARRVQLAEVRIRRPTLEDVFFELTAASRPDARPERAPPGAVIPPLPAAAPPPAA